jgi:allantoinase
VGYDLLVRGVRAVLPDRVETVDLGVAEGQFVAIAPELTGPAREEVDGGDLVALPGLVDAHVHFNEPGRTEWEGIASGSRALVAGGGTVFMDMPLNSSPPTLTAEAVEAKRRAAEAASVADFALWGGLVPGNVSALPGMAEAGVVGFKAFLCSSGLPEFPACDDLTLYEGMRVAATLGLPVAVHVENEAMTRGLTERLRREGRRSARDYLTSRPVVAELEAIQRVLLFAQETGAQVHIVHASCGRAVSLVDEARRRGVRATCETCPHYLLFTEEDLERLGPVAKCAPPFRSPDDREALWAALLAGQVDFVASDHSPAPPELKRGDFFEAWGGINGVQCTLGVLLTEGYGRRGLGLEQLAALVATRPAQRFGFPQKGRIQVGADADFALLDLASQCTLGPEDLLTRHRESPYVGRTFRGIVRRTFVRGRTVYRAGQVVDRPHGRFLRPGR